MKITLKTLKNEQTPLEIEPSWTVGQVKEHIHKVQGHEPAWQKLIFAGKVLEDSQTIASYGVNENDFMVIMVRKPAGAPSTPAAPVAQPQPQQTPIQPQPPAAQPQTPVTPVQPTVPAQPTAPQQPAAAAAGGSGLATGAAAEALVDRIAEMGFPKDEVRRALRAAFNNPDRAVEYLMTGIPENIEQTPAPQTPLGGAARPAAAGAGSAFGAVGAGGAGAGAAGGVVGTGGAFGGFGGAGAAAGASGLGAAGATTGGAAASGNLFQMAQEQARQAQAQRAAAGGGVFDALRQNPQFNMLRALVQQNPQVLPEVLRQLGAANPQILQLISQNQEEFMRLLQEPVDPASFGGAAGAGGSGGGGGGTMIQVTAEEREALQRLESMGFSRQAVLEAWLACDRNEELAANYLLENASEYQNFGDEGDDDDISDEQ